MDGISVRFADGLDSVAGPKDGEIVVVNGSVVLATPETLMKATDNIVMIAGLRNVLSGLGRKHVQTI